jgi:ribosome-associated translation inhibitor RaiA
MDETEVLNFGTNIQLSGFKGIDPGSMVILKKMIGNSVKKISETSNTFEKLTLNLVTDESKKLEITAVLLDNGKTYNSKHVEKNLFMAIGEVLKKLETKR